MNSKQIAELANVSRSTVSRVLNNYSNVPTETREKVQKIIDKYGYTPNHCARNLAGKSNNIIGFFLADINETNSPNKWIGVKSPYNIEFMSQLIIECKNRDFLTLVNTFSSHSECSQMMQYFDNRMLSGGIFLGFSYKTKIIDEIAKKNHNAVFVDQFNSSDDPNNILKLVNTDNILGGYKATKYLIEKGHKKIAHISGDQRLSSLQRQQGYLQAMKENNLQSYIIKGSFREDISYQQTKIMLDNYIPTAIFAANDIIASGCLTAINEKGLSVPDDISLIGFDNISSSEWFKTELTTLNIDMSELVNKSVSLLLDDNIPNKHILCKPNLIEKNTVKTLI